MNPKDYLIAKELKEKLSKVVLVTSLIVFGSRAKGTQDEYSDMDVSIVVASLNEETNEKFCDLVWEVGFNNFIVISPLIFTTDELENSPLRSAPIVESIMNEGVKI